MFIGENEAYKVFIDTKSIKSKQEGDIIFAEAFVKYEYTPSGKKAVMKWLDAQNYFLEDFKHLTYSTERLKISYNEKNDEYKLMTLISDLYNNEGRSLETFDYTKTTEWKRVDSNSTSGVIAREIIKRAFNNSK